MKNTKKGFTLVELLVVIAIVAILATVAIIGYTSFTKKAEQAADQAAVSQMNTVLEAAQAGGEAVVVEGNDALTAINIFKVLVANEYNDELVAYYEKYSFGYVVESGKAVIVLVEDGKIAYPEAHEGKTEYKEFFKSVDKADQLVDAFKTGYVLLKTDAVFTEAIKIDNDLTIVGNDKVLRDDAHINRDDPANSAINITGATKPITVTMSGVDIINPDDISGRGLNLSANQEKVTLIIDDCNIESLYYALNIGGSQAAGFEIVVRNSVIDGWAALNVWSKANITFENCTLIGNARSDEGFGTIVVNSASDGSIAAGSTFTFKNCTIEANNVSENSGMVHVDVRTENTTFTFEGCTFKVNGEVSDCRISTEYNGVDYASSTTITIK